MSVSFTSEDFNAECNFSNRSFSDIWKLLGFKLNDDSWIGEMNPILFIGRVKKAKRSSVATVVRSEEITLGDNYMSFDSGVVISQGATIIDCGSSEEQILIRLDMIEKVCIYCIKNNCNLLWG